MSDFQLGPRTVYYVTKDGSYRPIILSIEFLPPETINLGDETVDQISGKISFKCDWSMRPITIYGQDKLQVVYGLMRIADTALQKISRDNTLGLFKNIPGDIKEPMDVFA